MANQCCFWRPKQNVVSLPLPFETKERKAGRNEERRAEKEEEEEKKQLKIIGDNQFQTSHIFSIYTVHIKSSFFCFFNSLLSVGQEVNETER